MGRQKPITRAEVRIEKKHGPVPRFAILTLPKRGVVAGRYSYDAVESLWMPLVRELKAEYDAYLASKEWHQTDDFTRKYYGHYGTPRAPAIPSPWNEPCECRVCGQTFFQAHVTWRSKRQGSFCSDTCMDKWRRMKRVEQRKQDSARRAEARTNRTCEVCGEPIEAARSTKRFCSTKCRVAAHRAASSK
jgi:hypothetical protein